MNLCDEPTRVSVGAEWRSDDRAACARVPIVVTGNDMSRLYAPLTRSGRMDLWMWEPDRGEIVSMVHELLKDDDGYGGKRDAAAFVAAFPNQPLDFFGASRSRCVDDVVRAWVTEVGTDGMGEALLGHRKRSAQGGGGVKGEGGLAAEFGQTLETSEKTSVLARPDVSLKALMRAGISLSEEQQHVMDIQLARDYVKNWTEEPTVAEIRQRRRSERALEDSPAGILCGEYAMSKQSAASVMAAAAAEAARSPETLAAAMAARDAMLGATAVAQTDGESRKISVGVSIADTDSDGACQDLKMEDNLPWKVLSAIECFRMMNGENRSRVGLLDIRPGKEHNREAITGSLSAPAATVAGGLSNPFIAPDIEGMVAALAGELGTHLAGGEGTSGSASVIVVHDGGASYGRDALHALVRAGYTDVVEMRGGMEMWLKYYTPSGKPRPRYVGYGKDNEETFWTASN